MKKRLPSGITDFKEIITNNYIYVDKSEHIYNLYAEGQRYHFLARPRRFGKSLLLSTLRELFAGNRELFKGLWIESIDFSWTPHQIIEIDFGLIAGTTDATELKSNINTYLVTLAKQHNLTLDEKRNPEETLHDLVLELVKKGPLALLVDEYDKPLLDTLFDISAAKSIRFALQSFYTSVKSLSKHFQVIFITGVTKFSKTSIFSGMNNLDDISESEIAATLLGYTEEEINHFFADHIERFSQKRNKSIEEIKAEMKEWYNGYRFSEAPVKVYSPHSVLKYLHNMRRKNYWFASGTPSFLVTMLKDKIDDIKSIENVQVNWTRLASSYELHAVPAVIALYQTGYLTITDYNEAKVMYTLNIPNEEVRESLPAIMLSMFVKKD